MGSISHQRAFNASDTLVWEVITDPTIYADVAPNLTGVEIVSGTKEGMVRRCVDTNGNEWRETCHYWDDGRAFGVTVDVENSQFHNRFFTHFEGGWRLTNRPTDVLVTITFVFDMKYGPIGWILSKYLAYKGRSLIEAIFDGWETALQSRKQAGGDTTNQTSDSMTQGIAD